MNLKICHDMVLLVDNQYVGEPGEPYCEPVKALMREYAERGW